MRGILLLAVLLPHWARAENMLACIKAGPESLEYAAMARVTASQGTVIAEFTLTPDGKARDLKLSGPRLLQMFVGQFLEKWTFSTDCKVPLLLRFEYTLRGAQRPEHLSQTIVVPPNTFWILDNPVLGKVDISSLTKPVK